MNSLILMMAEKFIHLILSFNTLNAYEIWQYYGTNTDYEKIKLKFL